MAMTSNYLTCAGREIHYTERGQDNPETVIMWHGLARTGRDFDIAADLLARSYRVICPDTVGRGLSQWAEDPKKEYCLAFYGDIAVDLVSQLRIEKLRWVGTSMGGAIGIHLAGDRLQGRISHLVINDIGPQLAPAAVERILIYAGSPPAVATMAQLEHMLRTIYEPFGYMSDEEWRSMAESSSRRLENGKWTIHYDPKMVEQFVHHPTDYDQWDTYDRVTAKTLLMRGAKSDLLLREWAEDMTRRGPCCKFVEYEGIGHAPALNVPDQLDVLTAFLAE